MKEEQVTKAILKWLLDNGWSIVCFDFPQSGTGKMLHPNGNSESKNKNTIIPDIVAVRDGQCVFVENKDRYYYPDFVKQHELIVDNTYTDAIDMLLQPYTVNSIFYGIGLPTTKYKQSAQASESLVDFVVCVNENKTIDIPYNPRSVVFEKAD